MFLLPITKGVEPKHKDIFTHRDRMSQHLEKVYKKSTNGWEEALTSKSQRVRDCQLRDTSGIEPYVTVLVRFAGKAFGLTPVPLRNFGVTDVQVALGALIKKLTAGFESALELAPDRHVGPSENTSSRPDPEGGADIPGPVLGGLLVATVAGDVGLRGSVMRDQAIAIRVGVGVGTSKPEPAEPEPKAAKTIRRTLEGLAEHIRALKE
jgi:hypothetical protein